MFFCFFNFSSFSSLPCLAFCLSGTASHARLIRYVAVLTPTFTSTGSLSFSPMAVPHRPEEEEEEEKKDNWLFFFSFFFLRSFPFRCILVVVEWCAVHSSNRHNNDLPSAILCALHFVWFLLLLFLLLLLLSFSLAATAKCCGKYTAGCAATRRSYSTHCARPHEFCAIAFTFCQPRTKAKKSNERTQTALIKSRHGAATETRQQPMSGLFPPFVPFYIHRCQYL